MSEIQVDMLEVQLGASMLLQFQVGERTVRVLADAGSSHGAYKKDHVLLKLQKLLADGDGYHPIDLLICTHYDGDHLNQLVPVVENFKIREAWLPPVAADDTVAWEEQDEPELGDYLGNAFRDLDRGPERLRGYLDHKARTIESVAQIRTDEQARWQRGEHELKLDVPDWERCKDNPDQWEAYFRQTSRVAGAIIANGSHAACGGEGLPTPASDIVEMLAKNYGEDEYYKWQYWVRNAADHFGSLTEYYINGGATDPQIRSLAGIEKSLSDQAITAIHLARVVEALQRKRVFIEFKSIADGKPDTYCWCPRWNRFLLGVPEIPSLPKLVLLGPSKSLIKKHWKRLPTIHYVAFALMQHVPVKSITPSNALSYSMVFNHGGQGVLISGDTGFVDFVKPESTRSNLLFYPELINELKTYLPIVQVAHHGGNNKYFYHALLEAGLKFQKGPCFLLLSHEEDSEHRPSLAFESFLSRVHPCDVKLLFTSRPRKIATYNYEHLYESVVGSPSNNTRGDVQIIYKGGVWMTTKHAVVPHI
ncbi:hypothetical protein N5E02_01125 [Stenotrophomonas sp. GD03777]|uniref:hypothetical protein n=1 Tax=Stenotrophomonas sp. GD03777 TaxID=2975380 RepID=UPI00244AF498|nr:hypothetical protein [Stenotrophomonas sp. GD03777]MDH1660018.1 hypothetical protein [Stenotrophomonas sp. GD03777]